MDESAASEILLPIAVSSVSSGKDSQETTNLAIDEYGPERVRAVMADTGHEHPEAMDFALNYLPSVFGIPVEIVRADFSRQIEGKRRYIQTHWEYAGVPLARIDRALELLHPTGNPYLDLCMWKGRFPSRKAQFCTGELKVVPLERFLLQVRKETGCPVESWQGVRRDESANRSDALEVEDAGLWTIRRPIVAWTAQQVVESIRRRGQRLNPLYSQGMKRVGCMPCINCTKDELREIAQRWPEEVERVREWEVLVAEVCKRGMATFFADPDKQGDGAATPGRVYANINDVVAWSKTSRGGKQFDLVRAIPSPTCTSAYGLCE